MRAGDLCETHHIARGPVSLANGTFRRGGFDGGMPLEASYVGREEGQKGRAAHDEAVTDLPH